MILLFSRFSLLLSVVFGCMIPSHSSASNASDALQGMHRNCHSLGVLIDRNNALPSHQDTSLWLYGVVGLSGESLQEKFSRLLIDPALAPGVFHNSLQKNAAKLPAELGTDYQVFAVHPGIASHLEAFIRFVKSREYLRPNVDLAVLEFRKHLGTVSLSRSLLLTTDELALIQREGLRSNFVRRGSTMHEMYLKIAKNGMEAMIKQHMVPEHAAFSPFSSFTNIPAIGDIVTPVREPSIRPRYTFRAVVDVLDVVYVSFAKQNLIQEAFVFGDLDPIGIINLDSVRPEISNVSSSAEVLQDIKDLNPPSPPIAKEFLPEFKF